MKQRSRQLWLSLGDRNTGYFHASAKGRRARNRFSVIESADGELVYEEDEIASVVSAYFLIYSQHLQTTVLKLFRALWRERLRKLRMRCLPRFRPQKRLGRLCSPFIQTRLQARMAFQHVSSNPTGTSRGLQ